MDNVLHLPRRKIKEQTCSCSDQYGISSKPVFNEMSCPASAGCGDVRVHAQEVLHAATLMLPEVNDAKFFLLILLLELLHGNNNKSIISLAEVGYICLL